MGDAIVGFLVALMLSLVVWVVVIGSRYNTQDDITHACTSLGAFEIKGVIYSCHKQEILK
jgi:hypothetical protein